MTKTFESGAHSESASLPPPAPNSIEAPAAASSKPQPPLRSKAVYNAVCTTSTSTSGSAVLMSTAENHLNSTMNRISLAEEDSVTNLDELELRALLDEAITYKTPKDREGKSKLFNTLLIDAEDDLRKEHAHNASGPARHFSSTAKKRHRQRRQPSSVSENLTHGGSLNDLAKQELYEYESAKAQRPKTVSTRQREGGSLPCNVNAGAPHVDKAYFMEERARQQEQRSLRTTAGDMHSALGIDYPSVEPASTFISQASIPITANKVDDNISFSQFGSYPATSIGTQSIATHNADGTLRTSALTARAGRTAHYGSFNSKKVDENDNVSQSIPLGGSLGADAGGIASSAASKRKNKQKKSLENVITAKDIKGHRSDIIENIDKLVSYIEGTEDKAKKKLHKQHSHTLANEDKNKKRTRKKSATMLHKSNSMEEMSITKLEDFSCRFEALDVKEKAPLRPTKSNADRSSRLGKGWVVSSEQLQMPVNNTSAENVEIADFIYVTKKKKSKKRRNSLGSRGNPPQSVSETRPAEFHSLRVSSPRRKSGASSAPHSEKSADSSDNESVHSLPLDGENKAHQISYADIAKSSERPKWNRLPSERRKNDKPPLAEEKPVAEIPQPQVAPVAPAVVQILPPIAATIAPPPTTLTNSNVAPDCIKDAAVAKCLPKEKEKETDTDLSSLQNWPEIRNNKVNQAKTNLNSHDTTNSHTMTAADAAVVLPVQPAVQDWPSIISNGAKPTPKQHVDNKPKKAKTSTAPPPQVMHANVNEHLQQVLQVQVSPSYESGVYVYRQNHDEDDRGEVMSNPQQVIQQVSEQSQQHLYQMPPNIHDVQTIEEMQIRSLQAAQMSPALVVDEEIEAAYVPNATASGPEKYRPAVVILSSGGDRHATSDITFGFGINEQLLSGDVCADFVSRFLQPDVQTTHVDQLVNYVASEWEDILMQTHTGKVKYYTDELS